MLLSAFWAFTLSAQNANPHVRPNGQSIGLSPLTQTSNANARLNPQGGGNGAPFMTASCGPDTVLYPVAKASNLVLLDIANGVGIGQWYSAPQPITVHGFTFYAFVDSSTSQTVTLTCQLYSAGTDSLPTGAALATTTVTIDSSRTPLTLGVLEKFANFSVPVTVNGPYVVTVTNTSAIDVAVVSNDYTVGDGAQEWLASVFIPPSWEHSYNILLGASLLDADFLLLPHVTYSITSSFTPTNATACTGTTLNWTDRKSVV